MLGTQRKAAEMAALRKTQKDEAAARTPGSLAK